jgi:predicted GTPase
VTSKTNGGQGPRREFARALERIEELLVAIPGDRATAASNRIKEVRELLLDQRPPRFALVGRRGSGKSSLINALFDEQVAAVGHERAQTGAPIWFNYAGRRGQLELLDTRGFQEAHEPEQVDEAGTALESILDQLEAHCPDAILFLVKATEAGSAMDGDLEQLEDVWKRLRRVHGAKVPVLAVVTQCDLLEPKVVRLHEEDAEDPDDIAEKVGRVKRIERQVADLVREASPSLEDALVSTIGISAYQSWRRDGTRRSDDRWRIEELVEILYEELPGEARLELVRLAQAKHLKRKVARALTSTVASVCALVAAAPIPGADMIPITSLQVLLVSAIGYIGGRSMEPKTAAEFVAAAGVNVGAGFAMREAARALLKLVPGAGNLASAAIAFAGTMGIGEAAAAYFIDRVPIEEAKEQLVLEEARAREAFEKTEADTADEIIDGEIIDE